MDSKKIEMLRYLGYRGQSLSPELSQQIDKALAECRTLSRPACISRLFPVQVTDESILLPDTGLVLEGSSIYRHLEHAKETAVMAATLGVAVEQAIRQYEFTDMTYALILDAAATQFIEETCDIQEEKLRKEAAARGFATNFRFSPGYGDLPLTIQPQILHVLDATKAIGLACTETFILTPRKSVTAFLGLLPEGIHPPQAKRSCSNCNLAGSCTFRKDGGHCGSAKTAPGPDSAF